MRADTILRLSLVAIALSVATPAPAQRDPWDAAERRPGRVGPIAAAMNEEAWFVPGGPGADGRPAVLKARIYRPAGAGPFNVAVVNHGSPAEAGRRPAMPVARYRAAAEWFVGRGYMVVLPMRRGYGDDRRWAEAYGSCRNPDYVAAGRAAADDIEAVVRYLRTLPMVRRDRVLLVGQSAGGFGVVAATQRNPEGVFAAVNIAGGRGGRQGAEARTNCGPERLVQAAGAFGAGARVPSLWLYSRNDGFFAPALSRRMHDAYRAAGGEARYRLLPPFGTEGHDMFGRAEGRALWTGPVGDFLKELE